MHIRAIRAILLSCHKASKTTTKTTTMKTVIQRIDELLTQYRYLVRYNNTERAQEVKCLLAILSETRLPKGSGFDRGCHIQLETSDEKAILIEANYHHMNDGGMYDGWSEHIVVVTPTFANFAVKVRGRDRNDIKNYIAETIQEHLSHDFNA